MIFNVEIYFHGAGTNWIITYKCKAADIYTARDVVVRRFLEDYYDDFDMVMDVTVHEPVDGRVCPHHFEVDIPEYDISYMYHNEFFEKLMAESHIENLGIIEDV